MQNDKPFPVLNIPLQCPLCGDTLWVMPIQNWHVTADGRIFPLHHHLPIQFREACPNENRYYTLDRQLQVQEVTLASTEAHQEGEHREEEAAVATRG